MSEQQIEMVPLKKLRKAPYQRRTVIDQEELQELAASIKDHGVLENLIGRKVKDGIEVVAGNRRWAGAELAGLKVVPVIIKDLTDEQAREICNIENLQRKDLDPIDEAMGFSDLMEANDGDAKAVSDKVRKPIVYVQTRLRLLRLGEAGVKALRANKITVPGALALARLADHDEQAELLKQVSYNDDPIDVGRIRAAIDRSMLDLSKAPFDIKSATLVPAAGACMQCPKKTGNQFALPGIDSKVGKDHCTDSVCFRSKLDAKYLLDAARASEKGLRVLPVKEAKTMFTSYGLTDEAKKEWVDVDHEFENGKPVREILKERDVATEPADQAIAQDAGGYGHLLMPRSLVKKLLKVEKSEADKEADKAKTEERARARMVHAVMEQAIDTAQKRGPEDPEAVLRFAVLAMLEQTFLSDDTWKEHDFKNHESVMTKVASGKASLRELGRIVIALTQHPNKKHTAYSESFNAMCDVYGIETAKLEADISNTKNKNKSKNGG